jgi:glutaredoxin
VSPPRVVLVTRVGCHLCEGARAVVADVCSRAGVEWAEQDVDLRPDLRARFTDLVPVVLVDGQEHARYHVDARMLARALG